MHNMSSTQHVHQIECSKIPTGLRFLRAFLPALDSLDHPTKANIASFLAPHAKFITNNGPPAPQQQLEHMFVMRAEKLSSFGHDVVRAWDVEAPAAPTTTAAAAAAAAPAAPAAPAEAQTAAEKSIARKTVMYESVSVTVFKSDPERKEVRVPEFNVIELEPVDGNSGGDGERGFEGLWAVELRCWMDSSPVTTRAKEIAAMEGVG
ncbi:hypothetical protein AJ78_06460 [Emergomyces pasteurianus Ep9510]|uniref:Uncharacterized protein n=1 Tax=Emergomyces pasteurianus Ep9510 TaxID=1447872 RepID=A0A1J9QCZ7_9EURO|nr:hypothetical protein AJ78_06460 [Emergomyces pasteurianus Ep9510]